MAPAHVASLFSASGFRWWIGGGWAVDAVTGVTRLHEDTDVVVLRDDLAAVRRHLHDFHFWEAESGILRPLPSGESPREEVSQLWLRDDAYSPWVLDLLLTPTSGDEWLYKRDRRSRRPLASIGFERPGGIAYFRPEILLLFKAKLDRPKDYADFQALLPHLTEAARTFLVDALDISEPEHPWLSELTG
ncbi:MAG: hypothetical protein JF886_08635 [Candidatus Dormibacteraeota bacterium]|uniref:Amino acid transporter n=1 Tax=Candidatus Aeolococcus gillhamiae TaxID=3127015 RepID=A0A934K123_9BACT|nr:hypothetical protein [Candidatus Dormibacteraeota bacterium]